MCSTARPRGHGAAAATASASISMITPAYRTTRKLSGSAYGAAYFATTKPDAQITTNANGVARTAKSAREAVVLMPDSNPQASGSGFGRAPPAQHGVERARHRDHHRPAGQRVRPPVPVDDHGAGLGRKARGSRDVPLVVALEHRGDGVAERDLRDRERRRAERADPGVARGGVAGEDSRAVGPELGADQPARPRPGDHPD